MRSDGEVIGPVVQVWANEPAKGGMLENPIVRHIGDRSFIVGTLAAHPDGIDDERVGLEYWFPVDEVYMLTTYPNLAAAHDAYRKYRERTKVTAPKPKRKGLFS
jgi:hypothetical protein